MKIRQEQLNATLQQQLAPIYLLTGDEPLLMQESVSAIRNALKQAQFTERQVLTVNKSFNWDELYAASQTLSLFADKTIIELKLETTSLGKVGGQAITQFCQQAPDDKCLLITCDKLDAAKQKTKWYKAVEQYGVVVPLWPVGLAQMPQWINSRLSQYQLSVDSDALKLLCDRVEGNLLAAKQEIEKCHLLYGSGKLSLTQVKDAVADSSRYDVFQLVDSVINGEAARAIKMLYQIRAEGKEPVLILWALHRELQLLCALSFAANARASTDEVCRQFRVWSNRKSMVLRAMQRHRVDTWQKLLSQCVLIDEAIKGANNTNKWHALTQLCLHIAGKRILA